MDEDLPSSPARNIGVTRRSVSGTMPNIGAYESTLERDFMELMRFDSSVKEIVPQPITISFDDLSGRERSYTPDGLLFFQDDLHLQPILYEIKHREDFKNSWKYFLEKFRAAKRFAQSRGWQFKVFTENEIRTPYLDNIKFLWPYKNQTVESEMALHILSILSDLQEADPELLLSALCNSPRNRAMTIPFLWSLIANSKIGCNLDIPLTMHSKIWVQEDL